VIWRVVVLVYLFVTQHYLVLDPQMPVFENQQTCEKARPDIQKQIEGQLHKQNPKIKFAVMSACSHSDDFPGVSF
jgi:hypothetical protein